MEVTMIEVDAARYAKLEAMEAKAKLSARRATVKNLIYVKKAIAANITVTKTEINAWIAADDAKKALEVAAASSEA
jgi:hypothetical protein